MICPHCRKDLNIFRTAGQAFSHCPFCGAALPQEMPQDSTLEQVLGQIVCRFGVETLRDGRKTLGMVQDLAPLLERREIGLLQMFLDVKGNLDFLDAQGKSRADQKTCRQKVHHKLCHEKWLAESAATRICDIFWQAVHGPAEPEDPAGDLSPQESYNRGVGLYEAGDYEKAVVLFRRAAEQGIGAAMCYLGACYHNGQGVQADLPRAVEYYHRAAEQGNAEALHNLGICHMHGLGVEKDLHQAVEYHRQAAQRGVTAAMYTMGTCYYDGQGVEKDLHQAVEYFSQAARQGHAEAMCYLGVCCHNGQGVEKDLRQAAEYYRQAADGGCATAMYNLGVCHENGQGVEKDPQRAVECYRRAAAQGCAAARRVLESRGITDGTK